MLGVGPGALSSDAMMMGIDPMRQREMMEESLEAIVPLLRGERVTRKTDWYTLADARLQHVGYTRPHPEVAVAAMSSPAGPKAAGRFGAGLLSIGATTDTGFMALQEAWRIAEQEAQRHGQTVHRRQWRLVGPMHIAETREQAIQNVRWGLPDWVYYYTNVIALPFELPDTLEGQIDALNATGYAVIGTPDDAIRQIERLQQQCGGAGAYLQMVVNWADFPQTLRSYELFARYVVPHFNGMNTARADSMHWVTDNREAFMGAVRKAKQKATQDYVARRGSD